MARGLATALQAALAGVAGGASGYAQYQAQERKRLQEEEERKRRDALDAAAQAANLRSEQREVFKMGGTRMARAGESVAGQIPSAVPLEGLGVAAIEQAELGAGPSSSMGGFRQTIGGDTFALPGMAELESRRQQSSIADALRQAEALGELEATQAGKQFDVGNRRLFEVYRQEYGGRGEYNPNLDYSRLISAKEAQRGRAATAARAAGGAAAGGRGLLPSVVGTARRLDEMDPGYVRALRPSGVVAAAQAPLMMAEAKGIAKAPAFLLSGAMNYFANEDEREYALIIRSVNDAVARASEKGVLTDRDIARFEAQVLPLTNDDEATSLNKFNTLKGWANWLNTGNLLARTPEETDEEFNERIAKARAKGIDVSAPAAAAAPSGANAELEQDRRDWDAAVRKYGRERVEREYGPRP